MSEVSSCNKELLELKQLEVQSLEKQISLLRDVSLNAPQRRDSFTSAQKAIKSLQDEVSKLQNQLAVSQGYYMRCDCDCMLRLYVEIVR